MISSEHSLKFKTEYCTSPQGLYYENEFSYSLDNFLFKIVSSEVEKELFNELIINNFHEILKLDKASKEYCDIMRRSIELDNTFGENILRIIAYTKNQEAVGTLCVYLDKQNVLPGEIKENCNYSKLRQLCSIMELGRMSIRKDYRLKKSLSFGLSLFLFDVAIKNNIELFIESSFVEKINMFMRIGFKKFTTGESFDQIYKIPKILCYYNFASNIHNFICHNNVVNNFCTGNYGNMIFELSNRESLEKAHEVLIGRNSFLPEYTKTYNIDFSELMVINS